MATPTTMTKTLSQYILIILVAAFLAPAKGAAQARLIVDDSTKVSSVKTISKKAKKQQKAIEAEMLKGETIEMLTDTVKQAQEGKLPADTARLRKMAESVMKENLKKAANAAFVPDPKRALWLALVCPGAGQIYNRKYWKLPIFYGGFLGCTYALMWNQQMYRDYSQAYLDIMDDDPNTKSYLNMLPPNYDITGKEERFKTIFKNRKNRYRRYRDMSAFAFVGVYILSVIDAYVDAQLSVFDISPDLSMQLRPAVIQQSTPLIRQTSYGIGCSFNF